VTPRPTRIRRAQQVMRDAGVDLLLVGPSADLRYLVDYHALPLERLTLLVVPAEGDPALIVPELEAPRAAASGAGALVDLRTFAETDDPMGHVADVVRLAGIDDGPTIAVQDRMWAAFLLRLQDTIAGRTWLPGSTIMRELRITKTADEVTALRRVGQAIDDVHRRVPELLRPGRTEADVGRDIAELILEEHDEVNFIIVASGPNGASPHHETGDRVLQAGDPVVVDIGGTLAGYCSDNTRNYVLGAVPDGYRELHDTLLEAQMAGVAAARSGATAQDVDRACRGVLTAAGYGDWFIHRTGHGIGVEEHEEPWIVEGNDQPLTPGMAFSIEPGIYVPERYGARIEDIVVVTEDGAERLNTVDRELTVVPVE
jgi:Xaa-Pro aminopeptidase